MYMMTSIYKISLTSALHVHAVHRETNNSNEQTEPLRAGRVPPSV